MLGLAAQTVSDEIGGLNAGGVRRRQIALRCKAVDELFSIGAAGSPLAPCADDQLPASISSIANFAQIGFRGHVLLNAKLFDFLIQS